VTLVDQSNYPSSDDNWTAGYSGTIPSPQLFYLPTPSGQSNSRVPTTNPLTSTVYLQLYKSAGLHNSYNRVCGSAICKILPKITHLGQFYESTISTEGKYILALPKMYTISSPRIKKIFYLALKMS